jgi:hypothetical protein
LPSTCLTGHRHNGDFAAATALSRTPQRLAAKPTLGSWPKENQDRSLAPDCNKTSVMVNRGNRDVKQWRQEDGCVKKSPLIFEPGDARTWSGLLTAGKKHRVFTKMVRIPPPYF